MPTLQRVMKEHGLHGDPNWWLQNARDVCLALSDYYQQERPDKEEIRNQILTTQAHLLHAKDIITEENDPAQEG